MTADQLVGRWKLVSWLARNGDGEVSYPFGERAEGTLVYTRGGWMSGQLAVSDRDALATNDVVGGDEIERAAAYSSYIAYAGTYEVVGDVVIHRVKMSLFPNWVNTEQRRYLEIDGDQIVLRTQHLDIGGDVLMTELRWAREE